MSANKSIYFFTKIQSIKKLIYSKKQLNIERFRTHQNKKAVSDIYTGINVSTESLDDRYKKIVEDS